MATADSNTTLDNVILFPGVAQDQIKRNPNSKPLTRRELIHRLEKFIAQTISDVAATVGGISHWGKVEEINTPLICMVAQLERLMDNARILQEEGERS